jgi:hypothetical protein
MIYQLEMHPEITPWPNLQSLLTTTTTTATTIALVNMYTKQQLYLLSKRDVINMPEDIR